MPRGKCVGVAFAFLLSSVSAIDSSGLVVVILSQSHPHHSRLAGELRAEIFSQSEKLNVKAPAVYLSHVDFPHVGDWTILPLITRLFELLQQNTTWIFFAQEQTGLNLHLLLEALNKYDHSQSIWLGHAIYDREPTIIHHFAFYEDPKRFNYPNIASGIAISIVLLERMVMKLKTEGIPKKDFSIDSAHELALFIWNEGTGQTLVHEPTFCVEKGEHCASFPLPFKPCDIMVTSSSLYFAVKTCQKFHKDRVTVVKKTWGKHSVHMKFFSDVEDASVPTVTLGVPNTEHGHCRKTIEILKYATKELNSTQAHWIVLIDDDTILSVARLRRVLSCYDPSVPVVLGERYGFNVHHSQGYNYITGGGGTVFSAAVLMKLTNEGTFACRCPSDSSPDDMYLGMCLKKMGMTVTHSPLFHQARPVDYAPEYLITGDAVSFHKHWMIDPVKVYSEWFANDDDKVYHAEHTEL